MEPFTPSPPKYKDRYGVHITLFVITLLTTMFSGGQLAGRMLAYAAQGDPLFMLPLGGEEPFPVHLGLILDGLRFAGSLLLFLTVHEFGHYFAARYHRVNTSLPYYIPLPLIGFGTLGAVIRIREPIPSTRKLFDIGVAGPLAGFVVALGILIYALATLPPPTYLNDLPGHEAMKAFIAQNGSFPAERLPESEDAAGALLLVIGETPLYWLMTQFFDHVPPPYEVLHYPYLFAAWLGLFFTALNLLPVGQLDGGHILYALVGAKWHERLARGFVVLLLFSGSLGFLVEMAPGLAEWHPMAGQLSWFILAIILYGFLVRIFKRDHKLIAPALLVLLAAVFISSRIGTFATDFGYSGWLIWCVLIVFLIRVEHPPVLRPQRLTTGRRVLAYLSIVIFILCFSIRPLYIM
ncbi:MAG: site-2 protease family protein [Rhodothermales bacterium]